MPLTIKTSELLCIQLLETWPFLVQTLLFKFSALGNDMFALPNACIYEVILNWFCTQDAKYHIILYLN